jgi:hypothetical protein
MSVTWLQMTWLHEISQSALATAVLTLGVVILLELRSIKQLRRTMDKSMGRVFEQLDLLRFDNQPGESAARQPATVRPLVTAANPNSPPTNGNPYAAAAALASTGMRPEEIAQRCGLAAGEARLLASMAAAREGNRRASA